VSGAGAGSPDVVRTPAEAAAAELEPLLVLEPLREFLDGAGLGSGELTAAPIGEGHSNVTFLIERGEERWVLRRPPRGPLPPSAHDVLREARLLMALRPHGTPVPEVLASCEDPEVIGAPFYLMSYVDGWVLTAELPAALRLRHDFVHCPRGTAFNEVLFRTFQLELWFAALLSLGALLGRMVA